MAPVTSIRALSSVSSKSSRTTAADLPPSSRVQPLEARAADGPDLPADGGRAGEAHLVDARIPDQQFADVGPGRQDVEHPGRHPGLDRGLGQQVGVQRRLRRRLQHHRVPRGQGGRELHRGHEQRRVPRDDRDHHADRDAQDAQRPAPGAAAACRSRGSRRRCRRLPAACSPPWRSGRRAGCGAAAPAPRRGHRRTDRSWPRWRRRVPAGCRGARRPAARATGRASNAARAAPTARSASSLVARGTLPTTSSEAGETTSIRSVAEAAGCHRPPMKNTSQSCTAYPAFGVGAATPGRRASGAEGAAGAPRRLSSGAVASGSPRTVQARAARVAAPASGSGCCHAPSWCRPEARPA